YHVVILYSNRRAGEGATIVDSTPSSNISSDKIARNEAPFQSQITLIMQTSPRADASTDYVVRQGQILCKKRGTVSIVDTSALTLRARARVARHLRAA